MFVIYIIWGDNDDDWDEPQLDFLHFTTSADEAKNICKMLNDNFDVKKYLKDYDRIKYEHYNEDEYLDIIWFRFEWVNVGENNHKKYLKNAS